MPNRLTKGQAEVGRLRAQTIASAFITLAYAATITLEPLAGGVFETTTVNATGNATINANDLGLPGQEVRIIVNNDATSAKTITFGTNFRASATLVGTASKAGVVSFISDGTSWFETGRATGL